METDETDSRLVRSLVMLAFLAIMVWPGDVALVGPLKSNGTPVRAIGLLLFFIWIVWWLQGRRELTRVTVVVWPVMFWVFTVVVSWTHVNAGGPVATDVAALNDRSVLVALTFLGYSLVVPGVVNSAKRMEEVLVVLALGSVICAVVALGTFVGLLGDWSSYFLSSLTQVLHDASSHQERLGLSRVSGTMTHPLELAVVLPALFPLMFHLARYGSTQARRRSGQLAAAACLFGTILAFSRSSLVALAVALIVYLPSLPWRTGVGLLVVCMAGLMLALFVFPTAGRVFSQLVFGAGTDDSIAGRVVDYPRVWRQFLTSPLLGSGPQSDPGLQNVLDNQWLGTLVQSGLLGLTGLLAIAAVPVVLNIRNSARLERSDPSRSLCAALASGVATVFAAGGTFDVFSFPHTTGIAALLVALAGAGPALVRDRVPVDPLCTILTES